MKSKFSFFIISVLVLTFECPGFSFADQSDDLQNHLKKAEKYADKMNWDNAIEEYSAAISLDPNNEEAHFELGNCYKLKYGAVLAENLKTLRNKVKDSGEACKDLDKVMAAAETDETRKLIAGAIKEWEKTVEINDKNYQAHIFLGTVYVEENQFDKAEPEFTKVTALYPKYLGAYTMLAVIYQKAGRLNLAIESIQKALAMDPKSELLHFSLGSLYVKAGMKEQAKQEYTQLENLSGSSSFYVNQLRDLMK